MFFTYLLVYMKHFAKKGNGCTPSRKFVFYAVRTRLLRSLHLWALWLFRFASWRLHVVTAVKETRYPRGRVN